MFVNSGVEKGVLTETKEYIFCAGKRMTLMAVGMERMSNRNIHLQVFMVWVIPLFLLTL
jgi:hypothetical protein